MSDGIKLSLIAFAFVLLFAISIYASEQQRLDHIFRMASYECNKE